ncbi:MAG: AraC family transcriptional regulator [Porticoccaceae bacterium]
MAGRIPEIATPVGALLKGGADLGKGRTIASNYVNLIFHALGGTDDIRRCFEKHGISQTIMEEPNSLVGFDRVCGAVFDIMQTLDMPNAGLVVGAKMHISTHGTVGMAVISSDTIAEAIDDLTRYYRTQISFLEAKVYFENDSLVVELVETHDQPELQIPILEALMLSLQNTLEFVSGRPLSDSKVVFAYPPPSYAAQYGMFFSGKVRFNGDKHKMNLPAALLTKHCITADQQIHRLAREQLQQKLQDIRANNLTVQHVLTLLRQRPHAMPSLDELAETFNISSRTLIRNLLAQNTNYRELRNLVHKQMATESLRNTDSSVDAIAMDLGYQDTASFRRAFKRWCGLSPSEYRTQQRQQKPTARNPS